MSDLERMKELVEQLDAAARAYYQESKEPVSYTHLTLPTILLV